MDPSVYRRPKSQPGLRPRMRERFSVPEPEKAPAVLEVGAGTDCFVTPADVARRMASYLRARPGMEVLEPSAGTGNLAAAVLETEPGCRLTAVESSEPLFRALAGRLRVFGEGVRFFNRCFLEYAKETAGETPFDRVIMNPPFGRNQARKHVSAALSLLKEGGLLVALVPCTFEHPGMEEIERLEAGVFAGTMAVTKIIEIENEKTE